MSEKLVYGLIAGTVLVYILSQAGAPKEDRCGSTLPMRVMSTDYCNGMGDCHVTYEDGQQGWEPVPVVLGAASKSKCRAK